MIRSRQGVSLLEVLVVIAIFAVLIGLHLPTIQSVRESATRADSQNRLRQISLACLQYAGNNNRELPADRYHGSISQPFMGQVLPYLEHNPVQHRNSHVPLLISPADPTQQHAYRASGMMSYAGNGHVFLPSGIPVQFPSAFSDGTSCTLLFAEHYSWCKWSRFIWSTTLSGMMGNDTMPRPTFGLSIGPMTSGNPPVSVSDGIDPNMTFQVRPCTVIRLSNADQDTAKLQAECGSRPICNSRLAQTPHPGGMLVALADGSVRQLRGSIAPAIYWGAVTPAAGEILGDW